MLLITFKQSFYHRAIISNFVSDIIAITHTLWNEHSAARLVEYATFKCGLFKYESLPLGTSLLNSGLNVMNSNGGSVDISSVVGSSVVVVVAKEEKTQRGWIVIIINSESNMRVLLQDYQS